MDKHRKIIALGVPRNRYLDFVDSPGAFRMLTYMTRNKAIANRDGFYTDRCADYIKKTHAPHVGKNGGIVDWSFLEPVEVIISVEEANEKHNNNDDG